MPADRRPEAAARRAAILSLPADRLPPQNLEAERGALGSMLLDNGCIPDVVELLAADDFYRDSHQAFYRAILRLYDRGHPVDAILLADELTRRGEYERAGGDDALAEVLNAVPHAANARYYAGIVAEMATGRRLIEAANETLREAYSGNYTADQLQEAAERRVFAVGESRARGAARPALEAVDEAIADLQRQAAGEVIGVPTGWPDLDDMIGGLQPGHVTIVAARPSMGKSAIGLNFCRNACRGGYRALFVSLEMQAQELGGRLLAAEAGMGLDKLGAADPRWARVWAAREEFRTEGDAAGPLSRLLLDDAPGRSVAQAAAFVRRMVARHRVDLVAIDYLQLLRADGDSRQEQVAEISRSLKTLARTARVPLLVLAQLNREVDKREDRRPRMSDLRESGQIEADADEVILLHRPDYYDDQDRSGLAELIVAKNRNGRAGSVKLTWRPEVQRFESYAACDAPAPAGHADGGWVEEEFPG